MEQSLLPLRRVDQVAGYPELVNHVPFYGIYGKFGVVVIKVKGFLGQLRPRGEPAPGSGKRKKHVDDNISGSPIAKKGRHTRSAGQAKIQVVCPIAVGDYPKCLF
jgi:hypothetical protein